MSAPVSFTVRIVRSEVVTLSLLETSIFMHRRRKLNRLQRL